jgi:hypothetical protein
MVQQREVNHRLDLFINLGRQDCPSLLVRVMPNFNSASERTTHGFFDIFRLFQTDQQYTQNKAKCDYSLIRSPKAVLYTYLSQSWKL